MVSFEDTQQYREDLRTRLDKNFKRKPGETRHKNNEAAYNERMKDHYDKEWTKKDGNYTKNESKYMSSMVENGRKGDFGDYQNRLETDFERTKGNFRAGSGAQMGAGFGLAGSFKTGKMDDFKSFFMDTPLVAKEATLNSLGIMTKQQKIQMATAGPIGKAFSSLIPLSTMAMVGSGMYEGEDPYSILQTQLTAASAFTGGVAGMRAGGVMSPVSANGYIRGASRLGGFATGAVLAGAAAYGITESLRDITSAESQIGQLMYESPKRELLASTEQTDGTLTMRQRALRQVNSSVFNDRGFTLGNEASILKNVSL